MSRAGPESGRCTWIQSDAGTTRVAGKSMDQHPIKSPGMARRRRIDKGLVGSRKTLCLAGRVALLRQDPGGIQAALGAETFQHFLGLGLELSVLYRQPDTGNFGLVNFVRCAAQSDRVWPGNFPIGVGRDRERKHVTVLHNQVTKSARGSCSQRATSFSPGYSQPPHNSLPGLPLWPRTTRSLEGGPESPERHALVVSASQTCAKLRDTLVLRTCPVTGSSRFVFWGVLPQTTDGQHTGT